MSGNHQHNVLRDHKKVGKRFIPPLLQIPNMQETSFRDNVLPCLVWVSAIFLRNKDRTAVHNVIQFLIKCGEILHDEKSPPLVFLNNFNRLTQGQKQSIKAGVESEPFYTFIRSNVAHQEAIFKDYPIKDHPGRAGGIQCEPLKAAAGSLRGPSVSHQRWRVFFLL